MIFPDQAVRIVIATKPVPTEDTLAHVAVSKYADHLPFYRQCQNYGRGGVDLDRTALASWSGVAAYHLAPVVDRILVDLKPSGRLFMDETRAPVLDPKATKTKTGYLWALTRDDRGWGGGDPPAVVFTYAPGRHGSHAMDILKGFDGILQVDGYTGYDALAEPRRVGGAPLTLAYCWAHSRRKLHHIYQRRTAPRSPPRACAAMPRSTRSRPASVAVHTRNALPPARRNPPR